MATRRLSRRPEFPLRRVLIVLSHGIASPLEFAAFAAITFGVYQIYHPAAWIVGGALGVLYAQQFAQGEAEE